MNDEKKKSLLTPGCSLLAAKTFADKVYDDFKVLYEEESKPKPLSYNFGVDKMQPVTKQIMTKILDELDAKDSKPKNVVFKPGFKPYESGKPIKPLPLPIKGFLDEIFSESLDVQEPPKPKEITLDEAVMTYYKEGV